MNILVLLIGGNPLPNYITAKYLLTKEREDELNLPVPDKIVFVYSKNTEIFKRSILKQLALDEQQQVIPINLDTNEREPDKIMRELQRELSKIVPMTSLHLNYTGGTKTMSVYSALTVIAHDLKRATPNAKWLLSDLDPGKHRLVVLPENLLKNANPEFKCLPARLDLREHVALNVNTLFALHGMTLKSEGTDALTLPTDLLFEFGKRALARYKKGSAEEKKIFRRFDNDEMKKIKRRNRDRKNQENVIRSNQNIMNILEQIFREFPISKDCFTHICNNPLPYVSFIEFFAGKWVEEIVLHSLQQLQKKNAIPIHEVRKGVEAEFDGRPCEMDVIAMRGYQLFLCSCTTSQGISEVKQKAFEALYRTEELGGEHAKTIVISAMYNESDGVEDSFMDNNNLKQLEKDLQQFDTKRNCSLIGLNEIEAELQGRMILSQKLRTIITKG